MTNKGVSEDEMIQKVNLNDVEPAEYDVTMEDSKEVYSFAAVAASGESGNSMPTFFSNLHLAQEKLPEEHSFCFSKKDDVWLTGDSTIEIFGERPVSFVKTKKVNILSKIQTIRELIYISRNTFQAL